MITSTASHTRKGTWIIVLFALVISIFGIALITFLRKPTTYDHRILVVHAFSGEDEYYERSTEAYENAAEETESTTEIRHIFLGLPHTYEQLRVEMLTDSLKSLERQGWKPDAIILHGDEAVHAYLHYTQLCNDVPQTPIVYAATLIPEHWAQHPMFDKLPITGFRDSLFIHENLQFFRNVWGHNADVIVKLDRDCGDIYDDYIYEQLRKAIHNNPLYNDNLICHIRITDRDSIIALPTEQPLLITGVSMRNTMANGPEHKDIRKQRFWGRRVLHNTMRNAKNMHYLQTHLDSYSNYFIDQSETPQVSMICHQFGDTKPLRILGGYFADLDTIACEAVGYAMRLIKGEDIQNLKPAVHVPQYYMDWGAMQKLGLRYYQWNRKAIIKNAPFYVRQPSAYFLSFILLFFIFCAAIFYVAYHVMLSQQKQHDLDKQQQQERLEWLLGGKDVGMWYLSSDRQHITLTPSTMQLFGIQLSEQLTGLFLRLIHPENRKEVERLLTMYENEGLHSHRVRILTQKDNTYHWFQLTYSIPQNTQRDQEIMGLIELVDNDQEAQEKLMQSMQAAEQTRLKEAFLANMTHDIRSPLATIVNFTDLLVADYNDMEKDERQLIASQVEDSTQTLLHLLSDVVDVSQMQLGEYRFMMSLNSVADCVRRIYHANSVIVPSHLQYNLHEDKDAWINVDNDRMKQVLNNFLSNAFKNTPDGSITVGWKVLDGEVEIYVEDTGVGISPERQTTIFEKFSKYDGQSGAGLGLNICKTIVEKQNGRIVLQSAEGKGSHFGVVFPTCPQPSEKALS